MHFLEGDSLRPFCSMFEILFGAMGVICLFLAAVTRADEPAQPIPLRTRKESANAVQSERRQGVSKAIPVKSCRSQSWR